MFGKIVLVILVLGAVAAALLVDRQQRLDLAAEMSRTHARLREHDQALWHLRSEIAHRTRPAQVRAAVERLGGALGVKLVPIPDRLDRSRSEPAPILAGTPDPRVPRGVVPTADEQRYGGGEPNR